jgi:hypothetical protein
MAGALDRPQASTGRVPLCETTRLGIAASARLHNGLRHHRSRASGDDRQCVLIAVRVDTDHVVQARLQASDRSSDSIGRVP